MEGASRKGEIFQGSVVKAFSNRTLSLTGSHPTCKISWSETWDCKGLGGPVLSGEKEFRGERSERDRVIELLKRAAWLTTGLHNGIKSFSPVGCWFEFKPAQEQSEVS